MEQRNIKKITASHCLSQYFLNAWELEEDTELATEVAFPGTLLSVNRFDLTSKLYYLDCLEKGQDLTFAKELYRAHIEAFSDGAFIEPGLKTKNSIQDYFSSFDQLVADIREHGFDPSKSVIPVGENGAILDGSHRTAIAIYYGIPLTIVRIPNQACCYDYNYFRCKGLPEAYLDFMAYQFVRFSDRVYTVCLWPAAFDEKKLADADRMIHSAADVAYKKEVPLNYHGVEQLMISFYKSMDWTGNVENGFSGIASKAKDCYQKNAPTTIYVISGAALDQVQELKQRIRDLYAIENSSIHITDTHEEALEAGKNLLFQNSVDFLNFGNPYTDTAYVQAFVRKAEAAPNCGSSEDTLALYGIPSDQKTEGGAEPTDSSCPDDYFYFWGARLPSLHFIAEEKRHSGDTETVRRIEAFKRKKRSRLTALKENVSQIARGHAESVSRAIGNLRSETKRTARVCYHRLKYRGQNTGTAERNIEDLQEVFLSVNTTTADYLIMRNWEGFYDDILLEGHNDIDLLCRDRDSRDIIVRHLDARPLTFDGFHYCFQYKGRDVTLDTRILGDGYYDRRWQRTMLKRKRLHPLGFYIMDSENYFYSLVYHAIYQKKTGLSEEYAQRLNQMSPKEENQSQQDFADQLSAFMRQHRYAYTETEDKSVVNNFGVTANLKQIRYPLNIRLRHFAQDIESKHLIQRLKIKIRNIIYRGQ